MDLLELSTKIKKSCAMRGVPVAKMLADIGARKGLIYDMEKRGQAPSTELIASMAGYLDVTADYLLGRASNPKAMYFSLDDLESAPDDALIETGFSIAQKDVAKVMKYADEMGLNYTVTPTKKAPAEASGVTGKEMRLLEAYRAKPEFQSAVDTLLGIAGD